MSLRMLIDTTQPEETRVVVQNGDRIEDFDHEVDARKQLKGNIYLAKVTRVEPSLQAAFVDYGGNRHGFLPFSEIHPDYYRIPISDREKLMAAEDAAIKAAQHEIEDLDEDGPDSETIEETSPSTNTAQSNGTAASPANDVEVDASGESAANGDLEDNQAEEAPQDSGKELSSAGDAEGREDIDEENVEESVKEVITEAKVDSLDEDESAISERARAKLLRTYKIQEVIKRRQILLVQVTKEERGNKGAALTTYLSLAGRYCVLMPNTNKGGGISRKISNANDRRRLKKVLSELDIPQGIAVIVRTAGSQRSKAEIRRDYEYLMRLWNEIRDTTFNSTAPALIYEEANLIKRAIRDLYNRDMEEVLVAGEQGYKAAKKFMKTLMPSHAKKVQLYKDDNIPLFQRHYVERHLDAMHSPVVQLHSGGYIVLNTTEALVAIDVNSGKATRERNI
ncbi:MAG: Rne/Rng family ribonuclease, partial [Kiloniellales bacterium]|nr:Rne/Rng family ribonuclease [Kiloniellales bacterium]